MAWSVYRQGLERLQRSQGGEVQGFPQSGHLGLCTAPSGPAVPLERCAGRFGGISRHTAVLLHCICKISKALSAVFSASGCMFLINLLQL